MFKHTFTYSDYPSNSCPPSPLHLNTHHLPTEFRGSPDSCFLLLRSQWYGTFVQFLNQAWDWAQTSAQSIILHLFAFLLPKCYCYCLLTKFFLTKHHCKHVSGLTYIYLRRELPMHPTHQNQLHSRPAAQGHTMNQTQIQGQACAAQRTYLCLLSKQKISSVKVGYEWTDATLSVSHVDRPEIR